ncbi:hypothetical protein OG730_00625 [Streptomyces sp. NBC_01298]|uniref:hypothetical protein n=1 Tax=Streptomyces sp. NBC_01298 TaxID=2903817 RepID=UPI002E0DFCDA|nr:hypothetical protein OG730_00625 [Streptomyces sp. NBC_01298]
MLKRFVIALSVAASALLLPAAGVAQAADDTSTTTATTATGGESSTATPTTRQIVTADGRAFTVGTGSLGTRNRDTADSSWGG